MDERQGGSRPGWVRDAELPRSLDELRDPPSGVVRLPLRIHWSGPGPAGRGVGHGQRGRSPLAVVATATRNPYVRAHVMETRELLFAA